MEALSDRMSRTGVTPETLMELARASRDRAYAPYSKFTVGAAVLMDDGSTYGGCNVENASFGLSICAERVAMTRAVADGKHGLIAVAVCGPDGVFCSPCGACRQFLAEFGMDAELFLMSRGELARYTVGGLLPDTFHLER